MTRQIFLSDTEETIRLGKLVAQNLSKDFIPLLLQGELGTGKTTFVRGLVNNLPGGDQAEISSPSFNLFNVYPTEPETIHFDLYRQADFIVLETLEEYFGDQNCLLVIEWIDHLPADLWPEVYLLFLFAFDLEKRKVCLYPSGNSAIRLAEKISHFASKGKSTD